MQEIQYYASQLTDMAFSCTMHWLPSHIDNTSAGKWYSGKYRVDKLAVNGRKQSNPDQVRGQLIFIREQILSASINLMDSIESKLRLTDNPPDGLPAVADDFDACVDADQDLHYEIPTQTYFWYCTVPDQPTNLVRKHPDKSHDKIVQ